MEAKSHKANMIAIKPDVVGDLRGQCNPRHPCQAGGCNVRLVLDR